MIIRGKTVFVYDIEVFPNVFICGVKNSESGNIKSYEISNWRNDLDDLVHLFSNNSIFFCGYNNTHYDDAIINYLLIHYKKLNWAQVYDINNSIKKLSDTIIASKDMTNLSWSAYKYAHLFPSLDLLTMMFSSDHRVSLKEMQVTMRYNNVQEYSGDFNSSVYSRNQVDEIKQYNKNDINSTCALLNLLKADVEFRIKVEDQYNISVLNKDSVNLGVEIVKSRYLAETGLNWSDIKDLRSPCDSVDLGSIIFPFIKYDSKELQDLLETFKKTTIDVNDKLFEKDIWLGDSCVTIKLGGIHNRAVSEIFIPKSDEELIDIDVTSMYPSILIEHKVYPKHLGEIFLSIYNNIRQDRVEAKRNGNKIVNETLKLALNGISGMMQNPYSWCYDPKSVIQLRFNGELMLLMLAEKLVEIGVRVINYNTDGLFCLVKNNVRPQFDQICKDWTNITKLKLEQDYFERFYQYAVSDYVGVKKGFSSASDDNKDSFIKRKGLFLEDVTLGKGMPPTIIAEAINKYFVYDIPIEETILKCKNVQSFLTYQKVNKAYSVEYNGNIIQHVNRFYMSNNGHILKKCKVDSSNNRSDYICISSVPVVLYNTFENTPVEEMNINYMYYLNEARKIINHLQIKELSLF